MGGRKSNPVACDEMIEYFTRWWLLTNNKDHAKVARRLQDEIGVQFRVMRKYFPKSAAIITESVDEDADQDEIEIRPRREEELGQETEYLVVGEFESEGEGSSDDEDESESGQSDEESGGDSSGEVENDDEEIPDDESTTNLQQRTLYDRPPRERPIVSNDDMRQGPPAPPPIPRPRQTLPVPRHESGRLGMTQVLGFQSSAIESERLERAAIAVCRSFRDRKVSLTDIPVEEAIAVLSHWQNRGVRDAFIGMAREQVPAAKSEGGGGTVRTEQRGLARAHDIFVFLDTFFPLDAALSIQGLLKAYRSGDLGVLTSLPPTTSSDIPQAGPCAAVRDDECREGLLALRAIWETYFGRHRLCQPVDLHTAFAPVARLLPYIRLARAFRGVEERCAADATILEGTRQGQGRRTDTRLLELVSHAVGADTAAARTRLSSAVAFGQRLLTLIDRLGSGSLWLINPNFANAWIASLPRPDFEEIRQRLEDHTFATSVCKAVTIIQDTIIKECMDENGDTDKLPVLAIEGVDLEEEGLPINGRLFDLQ